MLEQWFYDYNPIATITEGTRTIMGARLFTDETVADRDYLYVGRMQDFCAPNSSREILIMYHTDVISIMSTDLSLIFNQVLAAFDFYADMESQMMAGVLKPRPEQCVLSACEKLLGPMFIMSQDYRILACSQNYTQNYVNEFWASFVYNKEPELHMISKMKSSSVMQLAKYPQHMKIFREPQAYPYEYGIFNTYCSYDGKNLGFFVLASHEEITPYEKDMAEIILLALNLIQARAAMPVSIDEPDSTEEIFLSHLLSGKESLRAKEFLQSLRGINDALYYCVVETQVKEEILFSSLQRELSKRFMDGITTRHENRVVLLTWSSEKNICEKVKAICQKINQNIAVSFGISNVFHDVLYCNYYLIQAKYALSNSDASVVAFSSVAVKSIFQVNDITVRYHFRHPAVFALEKLDQENKTELVRTLRTYLECERSIKKAAEKLYVHRNTILYRIDQIRNMELFDLENDGERQYLLVSLLVEK
jgi:hypothetical protein